MRLLALVSLIAVLPGCDSQVPLKGTPVSVAGKVSRAGRPLGGIVMIFQPLEDGHVREFPIQRDGSFHGEVISGPYAYYVAKPTAPAAAMALNQLSPKYFDADLARTVTVEPGKQLAIALD